MLGYGTKISGKHDAAIPPKFDQEQCRLIVCIRTPFLNMVLLVSQTGHQRISKDGNGFFQAFC
jgi:hypothetical protein